METSENGKGKRGGARKGAGRKPNSGAYGESTRPVRLPESWAECVKSALELKKGAWGQDLAPCAWVKCLRWTDMGWVSAGCVCAPAGAGMEATHWAFVHGGQRYAAPLGSEAWRESLGYSGEPEAKIAALGWI